MVLDLGGGTVDMTLHSVDSLLGGADVSLSEVTHRECLAEVSSAATCCQPGNISCQWP